jgi:transposase-like protein
VYVWAAVDVETFEVLHIEVSSERSSLDAVLFLREVLKYGRGPTGHSKCLTARGNGTRGEIVHSSKLGSAC